MIELLKNENNKAIFKFSVATDVFAKAEKTAYNKFKNKYIVPGFRKGKAPFKIIENHYGEGVFFEEAVNIVLPDAYERAVKELKLDTVERPDIDILEIGKGQDLVIEASVTVKPEVTLGDYKGLSVERQAVEVTDEDIETAVEKERELNARMIAVEDRASQEGDTLTIDYKGTIEGEAFEGGAAENHSLTLGSNAFIGDFEKQLEGLKSGDEKTVEVTFPEDYNAEHLAGKPAIFEVVVKEIKTKELPELDDEFAKDVSEFDTLDAYKDSIREKLTKERETAADNAFRNSVIEQAVDNADMDIPEVMVNTEMENMLRDFDYQLRYQGLDLNSYLQYTKTTKDDLKSQMKSDAEQRVKMSLVIEAIAKKEEIEATEEEIEEELKKIADAQKMDYDKAKEAYAYDEYAMIKDSIKSRKTVDLIVESIKS